MECRSLSRHSAPLTQDGLTFLRGHLYPPLPVALINRQTLRDITIFHSLLEVGDGMFMFRGPDTPSWRCDLLPQNTTS